MKCFIPSRMGSTRFYGKALAMIDGIPMIVRIANTAIGAFGMNNVKVLTDHNDIFKICSDHNIPVDITKPCNNSTERVFNYIKNINDDLIIEIQGDEPLITSEDLIRFANYNKTPCCMVSPIGRNEYDNKNVGKAITNDEIDKIFYITRQAIKTQYKHVGVYRYTKKQIIEFQNFKSNIEKLEDIHPMRWIQLGYEYYCMRLDHFTHPVDVHSDISIIETFLNHDKL